jgi:hypothetical protein
MTASEKARRACARRAFSLSGGLMDGQYPWTPNPKLTPG